jgi:hypothetical protein
MLAPEMLRQQAEAAGWYLARSLPLLGLAALLALLLALPAGAQQQTISCASNVAHTSAVCEATPSGISTATESGHLVKTGGGVLIAANLNNWGTSSGVVVMALDAAAIPANGTLAACSGVNNANGCIMAWYGLPTAPSASQPSTLQVNMMPGPFMRFQNGIVFVCSSSGPFALALTAECTFSAEVQ